MSGLLPGGSRDLPARLPGGSPTYEIFKNPWFFQQKSRLPGGTPPTPERLPGGTPLPGRLRIGRSAQHGPRWPNMAPKISQHGSKNGLPHASTGQHSMPRSLKSLKNHWSFMIFHFFILAPSLGSRGLTRAPKSAPRVPKICSESPQKPSKWSRKSLKNHWFFKDFHLCEPPRRLPESLRLTHGSCVRLVLASPVGLCV